MTEPFAAKESFELLSRILFLCSDGRHGTNGEPEGAIESVRTFLALPREARGEVLSLASTHHVLVRTLLAARSTAEACGLDWPAWAERALEDERGRIANALEFLYSVCARLEAEVSPVIVIKSLEHWPDIGSDLDLFTSGRAHDVASACEHHFQAQILPRSWGDRLARKWNFALPGLPELVEIHVGRLGQTGEQVELAGSMLARARIQCAGVHEFRVPGPEDRILVSTLQRMYRHFYLRLCDLVDMARIVESESVGYTRLRSLAESAGLWQGVATYLVIVSDYIKRYRKRVLCLPESVVTAAYFGGDQLAFRRGFLRIPLLPHSVRFYAAELQHMLMARKLRSTLRLTLLPGLAAAAALEQRITGSAKLVW
jgi:hypothetical protein